MEKVNVERFDELLKSGKPVVCDFFATWCGPCRMLAPVMDKMDEKYGDKAVFVKVDTDENPQLAIRYGVTSIPLVVVFKDGEVAEKSLGYMSPDEADEFFSKNI